MVTITDDRLRGWLCFWALQDSGDHPISMPGQVRALLVLKGWLDVKESENGEEGQWLAKLTEAGETVCDLEGPHWGINTIPAEGPGQADV